MQKAKISVILPVYNAEQYLRQSIDSIFAQTFRDFELIIIDDGSSDRSQEIVRSYKDERIRFFTQPNSGLAATLNRGIELAACEYIARQDNDDLSLPGRLQAQFQFFEAHPHIALLGTGAEIIEADGAKTGRSHQHPLTSPVLKFHLLFDNPFVHSSVMFRRSVALKVGKYSTDNSVFEDHNLWSRIAREYGVGNMPEKLVRYREVHSGMSKTTSDYHLRVQKQAEENLRYYATSLTSQELKTFLNLHFNLKEAAGKKDLQFHKSCLEKIAADFSAKEQIKVSVIRKEIYRQQYNFRRKLYQSVISSEHSSAFLKFKSRIMRRIFFLRNHKWQ